MTDEREGLAAYLIELAENPRELLQLREDPDTSIAAARLLNEEEAALRSRDPEKIRDAIVSTFPEAAPSLAVQDPSAELTISISITIAITIAEN